MKPTSLSSLWPRPYRKLTSALVQSLSHEDFYLLCRLVYKRNRKHHPSDRHARRLVRRLMRRRKGIKIFPELKELRPELFFAKYRPNPILDKLHPNRARRWLLPVNRRDIVYFSLKNFSFVDFPNETMRMLRDIAAAECTARAGRLDFKDVHILDIGPYVVWGLMSKGMAPFLLGGTIDVSVKKVIEAVGLRKFMSMQEFRGLSDYKDVWAFPLKQRNPGTPTAAPAQAISFSIVADQLVDTIDEWLGALPTPLELTPEAASQLNRITTELLDNAERHSRPGKEVGDWYVAGFMARRRIDNVDKNSKIWYDCHLAIVNLGTTIAESIRHSSAPNILADLNSYITRHHSRDGLSSNALATLYAMQDGVSSLPEGAGGRGMMEMVQLSNELGDTDDPEHQSAISIISGRSCIRFEGRYRGCIRLTGREEVRIQPFNLDGNFSSPPDSKHVFDLDFDFPGTIVALRFSLDYEALMQKGKESD